jgi:predicted enzyme related to lactoylglutathione lyase
MDKFDINALTWFEIPTLDIERAARFYETVLSIKLKAWPGPEPTRMFPIGPGGVGGCLVQRHQQRPVADGTLVYLNVDGRLDEVLSRARENGSKLIVPRTAIGGAFGFYALLNDSEGNHVGLHSR